MMVIVLAFGVPIGLIVAAVYLMRHRSSRLTRGVAAASATYNELYGQGRPPQVQAPAEVPTGDDDG